MKNKLNEMYNKMTIGNKISFIYTCVFMIMIIIVSIIALFNMWISYNSTSKSEINEVANRIENYISKGNAITKNEIEELIDNPYIDAMIINKSEPHRNDIGTMKNPEMFPRPDTIDRDKSGDSYGRNKIANIPYMFMHRVFEYNGETYEILIFRKNSNENRTLYICLITIAVTNIISILVVLIIGKYISKKILAPLRDITNTAENISLYDLSQRICVPETKDEIQTLVITLNDMITRLQESFEKENRFISDASHELKTPIAIIKGYINMIDRWGKNDPEILNEAINSIKSETEHMDKLIQQLLYLARDTQCKNQIKIEEVSLSEIAEDVIKEIEVSNDNIVTTFINEANDLITINSDEHLLKQLMWIFADNAIKYSGCNQCLLTIKVGYLDNKPYFSVSDKGIGISEESLDKIFDRFYRYDESRNKKIEGNGLGLAIAKSIAKKLNAKISVESKINEGSTFTVKFS